MEREIDLAVSLPHVVDMTAVPMTVWLKRTRKLASSCYCFVTGMVAELVVASWNMALDDETLCSASGDGRHGGSGDRSPAEGDRARPKVTRRMPKRQRRQRRRQVLVGEDFRVGGRLRLPESDWHFQVKIALKRACSDGVPLGDRD